MILICGGLADIMTELVCSRIEHLGYEYRLLDLGHYPGGYSVNWIWDADGPSGTIRGPDWILDLSEIRGVYVRYLGAEGHVPLDSVPEHLTQAMMAETQAGVAAVVENLPCLVVNRAAPSMSNHSTPYQALAIRRSGLRTPRTLITGDPAAAHAFYDECGGEVIFKSLSGARSVVRRMEPRDLERLPHLRHGPAQFQAYVPGDNIRVHAVGDTLFATRVRTAAVDYRYAGQQGASVDMEPATLPPAIAAACREIGPGSGLLLAGIDLKETPAGEYYCFEINPCPAFAWYERQTGQPISAALVDLLRDGSPPRAPTHLIASDSNSTRE
jgi:hypothetical protein